MQYISTRDARRPPERLAFEAVLLAGLARDGGLYVPESFPRLEAAELRALRGRSYAEIAAAVMAPFLGSAIEPVQFRRLVDGAYRNFGHPAVAPLKQLESDLWLLELFHGPTLAFKDYALQLVGPLFDHVLGRRGERVTIIGATSGDTGSAAIEACRDRKSLDVFILYPEGRVSEVQRRQMTTVPSANVHAIAVKGTFDDCQDLVKAMFADTRFRAEHNLSAVNSINWARVMAQVAYYFAAALALGAPDRAVSFAVPTGNFGNVYAAHVARRMGLPIAELVIGTNQNDILTRFLDDGAMTIAAGVEPSLSPSMDIQVSSNFERLYHELKGGDGAAVAAAFKSFRATGTLPVSDAEWRNARELFSAARVDDTETLAEIGRTHRTTGELLDPHSAIAVAAARRARRDKTAPIVALASAHPAKFPDAVERATGIRPPLPPRMADLYDRPEHTHTLPNELSAVQSFIAARARPVAAPARAGGGF
ncbi:MAG TPA: threonine synthase [Stellaceae bacterium]|nr:threonine synthase [Stellaceae bacterium]